MKSDVDEYGLRDKFAIEVLQAFISREGDSTAGIVGTFINGQDGEDWVQQMGDERMESLIRAAYKVADMMRKVRLTVFT